MQVRKKMWLLTRSSVHQRSDMDLSLESSKIRVVAENRCSVGYVARIIVRRLLYCIRVEDLKSIILMRHK